MIEVSNTPRNGSYKNFISQPLCNSSTAFPQPNSESYPGSHIPCLSRTCCASNMKPPRISDSVVIGCFIQKGVIFVMWKNPCWVRKVEFPKFFRNSWNDTQHKWMWRFWNDLYGFSCGGGAFVFVFCEGNENRIIILDRNIVSKKLGNMKTLPLLL